MKGKILVLVSTVMLMSVLVSSAYAWGVYTHTSASADLGSKKSSLADDPDYWPSSNTCGQNNHWPGTMEPCAETYMKEAIKYFEYSDWWNEWYNDSVAENNLAYALHFIEDAGQPWHANYVGGDLHISYETWVTLNYSTIKDAVIWGRDNPASWCAPSSKDAIDTEVTELKNAVAGYYSSIDTEAEWKSDSGKQATKDAVKKMASCAKKLMDYARSFDK